MNKTLLPLLLGIGIGVLLAPAKGSDTWRKIVEGIKGYADQTQEEGVMEQGQDLTGRDRPTVRSAME